MSHRQHSTRIGHSPNQYEDASRSHISASICFDTSENLSSIEFEDHVQHNRERVTPKEQSSDVKFLHACRVNSHGGQIRALKHCIQQHNKLFEVMAQEYCGRRAEAKEQSQHIQQSLNEIRELQMTSTVRFEAMFRQLQHVEKRQENDSADIQVLRNEQNKSIVEIEVLKQDRQRNSVEAEELKNKLEAMSAEINEIKTHQETNSESLRKKYEDISQEVKEFSSTFLKQLSSVEDIESKALAKVDQKVNQMLMEYKRELVLPQIRDHLTIGQPVPVSQQSGHLLIDQSVGSTSKVMGQGSNEGTESVRESGQFLTNQQPHLSSTIVVTTTSVSPISKKLKTGTVTSPAKDQAVDEQLPVSISSLPDSNFEKVQCPLCGIMIQKRNLKSHVKTARCQKLRERKAKYNFGSAPATIPSNNNSRVLRPRKQ